MTQTFWMRSSTSQICRTRSKKVYGRCTERDMNRGWYRSLEYRLRLLLLFAYYGDVPSSCKVGFTDGAGVTHSVGVTASSMYEAAVLGLAELKRCGFAMAIAGPATRLTVMVEAPATTHELSVARLQAWLDA